VIGTSPLRRRRFTTYPPQPMHRFVRLAFATLTLAVVASCDRATPLESTAAPVTAPPRTSLLDPVTGLVGGLLHGILDCPSDQALSATTTIGPEGGSLAAGGFRVDFPAGAVESPQTFVLDVPAGRYLQIDVRAEGYDHYWFDTPVTVTLDASRCGLLPPGLQVWNDDPQTYALLAPMGGVLDLLSRTVQFRTSHFSGYTIAWGACPDGNARAGLGRASRA
jgi:hypothetical protein